MGQAPSVVVPDTRKLSVEVYEGHGPIHRNPDGLSGLIGVWDPQITTIFEGFSQAVKKFGPRKCLGTRKREKVGDTVTAGEYEWKTYREINERVENAASGMRALGLPDDTHVGIYAQNCEEWVVAEHSCYRQSFVSVSIYDTLGADNCQFVVNQAEIPILFFQANKIKMVLECLKNCPGLKFLISFSAISEEDHAALEAGGAKHMTITELEAMGKASPVPAKPPQPGDMCTIMYTSGTTGEPKGVMLTHSAFIADVAGGVLGGFRDLSCDDVHLSYLPMAHIFERVVLSAMFAFGASAGFYQGDPKKILDDLQVLQPSMFFGVPRVFNLLYERVMKTVSESGMIKRWMFEKALATKLDAISKGLDTPKWNALVFSKIKERIVGTRCRRVISGSAPLSEAVQNFLRCILCCPVLQGYGLTETCAAATVQYDNDVRTKSVGGPMVCCELRLEDVPEMGYLSSDPIQRGEVLIRGLNLFSGYYKNPEETAKVMTADGWFHSGDVGQWNEDGTLSIIDRRKNIFKLSQGEYIAAEKLELVYQNSPLVSQIWIYGSSLQSVILAFVVPNPENLAEWAATNINVAGDFHDPTFLAKLCADERCVKAVLDELTKLGKQNKFAGFEFPKGLYLDPVPWTIENNLMTAAFKTKRPQMIKHYQTKIDEMYEKVNRDFAAAAAK